MLSKQPKKPVAKQKAKPSFWIEPGDRLTDHFQRLPSRTYGEHELDELFRAFNDDLSTNPTRQLIVDLLQKTSNFLSAATTDPVFKRERDSHPDESKTHAQTVIDKMTTAIAEAKSKLAADNATEAAAIFDKAINYCEASFNNRLLELKRVDDQVYTAVMTK